MATTSPIQEEGIENQAPPAPAAAAVTLRPLGLADADDFMVWASDERVMRFLRRPMCATREQAVEQIENTVLGHPWFRAICAAARPVGQVSVWPYAGEGGRRANLGFALERDVWGRGVATAAVNMVVGRVFEELPELERLEAIADVENVRSQRVLEKTGFQKEAVLRNYTFHHGTPRDVVMYSFLSSDRSV